MREMGGEVGKKTPKNDVTWLIFLRYFVHRMDLIRGEMRRQLGLAEIHCFQNPCIMIFISSFDNLTFTMGYLALV